jgi:1-acyl-sn-glycerol-3-phosphate acyltransferase
LDTFFSLSLDQFVQSVLLFLVRGTAKEELGRQPPVGDVYRLLGVFEGDRNGPKVVPAIDVPAKLASGFKNNAN